MNGKAEMEGQQGKRMGWEGGREGGVVPYREAAGGEKAGHLGEGDSKE